MPKDFREKHAEFPWRETASLRNVIAHAGQPFGKHSAHDFMVMA
jgi:uncharacterized protein with HEPN domain